MLVDHHCHLDFPALAEQEAAVVERARQAGVGRIVTISTRIREFDRIRAITQRHDDVFCSIGTHPHNAHEELDVPVAEIVRLSQGAKVVAIGEAGLDYYYDKSPRDAQAQGLRNHIAAARETGLPLVIHSRDADADMAAILEEEHGKGAFSAVLHCFTGGRDLAERAIALGHYVSFSGVITFKNSDSLREIARVLPPDRILVETDSPFLAPVPMRGKQCEPAYVAYTARCLAELRGMAAAALAELTTENFFRLYAKTPRLSSAS